MNSKNPTPDVSSTDLNSAEKDFAADESLNSESTRTDASVKEKLRSDGPRHKELPKRFQHSHAKGEEIDPQLINETKNQIRVLVQEIRDLAASDCSPEQFYQGFLARTTGALASVGGAIWLKNPQGQLQLEYHVNLAQTELSDDTAAQARHSKLIEQLIQDGQPTVIPPNTGSDNEQQAANPTQYLLVVGPLSTENEVDGLVEIFQRPGGGPTTQRGYLRFLVQMCEIASGFLKNQRLKEFSDEQDTWRQLEQFIRSIHCGLDTKQTIYTLANEARRFAKCDRVSIAMKSGRRCKIQAVSGLDTIERRAEQVKLLGQLATATVRADQPLWYNGDDADLPPQIEQRLQTYLDRAHSKMVAIVPIYRVDPRRAASEEDESTNRHRKQKKQAVVGAIIFEQLSDDRISKTLQRKIEVVRDHGSDALTNSIAHNSVFLMPLWRALGHVPGVQQSRRIPKWIFAAIALAGIVTALCLVPYDFSLGANGKLVPTKSYEIFAPMDGVLKEIMVADDTDEIVEADQPLARLENLDLMSEIESLQGQRKSELEQQTKLNLSLSRSPDLTRAEQEVIVGDIRKSKVAQASIEKKLAIKQQDLSKLLILAPARGQVVNWQLRQQLIRRPVKTGHNLMTIVDPDTDWELEIEMPERRVHHLMQQQKESETLHVTFTLQSHPGKTFTGTVSKIDRQMDVYSDEGNSTLVRVVFDKTNIPTELLRSGTRVTAKVHCGQRSSGYVLFHELIETVRANVLFWF